MPFPLLLLSLLIVPGQSSAQGFDTLRIASYNVLNYPGSTSAIRNPEFRKVVHGINPDLLVVQEMTSQSAMNEFLTNVMNVFTPGDFSAVPFNDGPDTDNGLFYRASKWNFISAAYIPLGVRDFAEYVMQPVNSSEQLRIYSVHLKASTGFEQQRLAEATILRDYLNGLPAGTNFIIVGDYNIYTSTEPAWQKLIGSESNDNGRSADPLNLVGTWNNNQTFAPYHTQSPRVRSFGGGATGGVDDRFDIILTSTSLTDNIMTSSYKAYGNDGIHFNDSINRLPNNAVPDSIANALHSASDHLPVTARFVFPLYLPVQLSYFTARPAGNGRAVALQWGTTSETNNFGFEIEKRLESYTEFTHIPGAFIRGHGTTIELHHYAYHDSSAAPGIWHYRLKQIDFDGSMHFTEPVRVDVSVTSVQEWSASSFSLHQNYPNPFNPTTEIEFSVSASGMTSVKVYNTLGQEVATLFDQEAVAGRQYKLRFDAAGLAGGIYMYRLAGSTGTSATRRMVLLK